MFLVSIPCSILNIDECENFECGAIGIYWIGIIDAIQMKVSMNIKFQNTVHYQILCWEKSTPKYFYFSLPEPPPRARTWH